MSEDSKAAIFGKTNLECSSSTPAMVDLIFGASRSCLIYCAAKLNIVDHLFENLMTAEQLAVVTETQPEMLYRLLRALASLGLLSENEKRQFKVNNLGLTLKSGVKGSVKNLALATLGLTYTASGSLLHTIRTGETAFENMYGMPYFDYLRTNLEAGEIFANSMKEFTELTLTPLLVSNYDYSGFKHIVDIGGGIGDFLIDVLEHTPNLTGTLFDMDYVVEKAKKEIGKKDSVRDRCTVVAGNFFDFIPSEGDCYIIKGILHDWNDEMALKILANIRKQLHNESKLLVMEILLPEGNEPHPYKVIDMLLSAILTGKERTKKDFLELFDKASLKLNRIIDANPCPLHIMELEAV